jgi:thiol-disulfide isomerase/thioredoxin
MPSAAANAIPPAVERIPSFIIKDISGREISPATLRGKVVLLDFWATWCPPCRKEIPHFNQLYAKYRDQGLMIVGLALDENAADVTAFSRQLAIEYPLALASKEVQQQFGGIEVYPTAFLVDREGAVIKKYLGFTYPDVFERDVQALLQ